MRALYFAGGLAVGALAAIAISSKPSRPRQDVVTSAAVMSAWCEPSGISQKDAQALLPHIRTLRPLFRDAVEKADPGQVPDIEGALFTMDVIEGIASGEVVVASANKPSTVSRETPSPEISE